MDEFVVLSEVPGIGGWLACPFDKSSNEDVGTSECKTPTPCGNNATTSPNQLCGLPCPRSVCVLCAVVCGPLSVILVLCSMSSPSSSSKSPVLVLFVFILVVVVWIVVLIAVSRSRCCRVVVV